MTFETKQRACSKHNKTQSENIRDVQQEYAEGVEQRVEFRFPPVDKLQAIFTTTQMT